MEGAEARRDVGLNQPHISHRHRVGRSVSQRVSACVPGVFPCFSLLSLWGELGVCQSSAVCRMEGATSAAAVLKRSCYYNTGQGTRTHSCLPGGHLPLLTLQLGLSPAFWGPSCPSWEVLCALAVLELHQVSPSSRMLVVWGWVPDPLVQECFPAGVTDIPS